MTRAARLRRSLEELFPERHLYLRSGGEMKAFVLTTSRQVALAASLAGAALWTGICTAALLVSLLSASSAEREVALVKAQMERYVADRQARLDSAIAQLNSAAGSTEQLAATVEKRHAALALLLSDLRGAPGAAQALTPAINRALAARDADPVRRVEMIRLGQDQLLEAADSFAKSRAERLRLAFHLAGLTPSSFVAEGGALGGPLIESRDPRALAAVLDVDQAFAVRIQRAAADVSAARMLADAAETLPFASPTEQTPQTSGYGMRFDPFTGRPAFHSGLDFSGWAMTPVYATAPGYVAFTGPRSGYGNTVEVDHGRGFKTRYAHLQAIAVRPGEYVALGQRVGGMGSTGRSTGTHLHYEVWVNGRPQNPRRFLRAGAHVHGGG